MIPFGKLIFCQNNAVPLFHVAADSDRLVPDGWIMEALHACVKRVAVTVQDRSLHSTTSQTHVLYANSIEHSFPFIKGNLWEKYKKPAHLCEPQKQESVPAKGPRKSALLWDFPGALFGMLSFLSDRVFIFSIISIDIHNLNK